MLNHNKIKLFFENLVDVVYPLRCLICKSRLYIRDEFSPLCALCFRKIIRNLPPFCVKCGRSIAAELVPANICLGCRRESYYFDRAWSSTRYEGVIRECIHQLKYNRRLSLINLLSSILIEFTYRHIDIERFDYILPIPLHRTKEREREFNQAYILAQPLAAKFKKKLLLRNIYRTRFTLSQSELASHQRKENIRGAFGITNRETIKGKNILIVDDVFTTGATVNECAALLKKNGAGITEVLTLAR